MHAILFVIGAALTATLVIAVRASSEARRQREEDERRIEALRFRNRRIAYERATEPKPLPIWGRVPVVGVPGPSRHSTASTPTPRPRSTTMATTRST